MSEVGSNFNNIKVYEKKTVEKNSEYIKSPLKEDKLKNSQKSEIKELKSKDSQEIHIGKESKSTIKSLDLFPSKLEKKNSNNKNVLKDKLDDSLQKLSPDDKQKLKDGIKNHKDIDKDLYKCKVKSEIYLCKAEIPKDGKKVKSEIYLCKSEMPNINKKDSGYYLCSVKSPQAFEGQNPKIINILKQEDK